MTKGGAPYPWTGFTWYTVNNGVTAIMPPQAIGQQGVLTGMTVTTRSGDLVFITAAVGDEVVQYRG